MGNWKLENRESPGCDENNTISSYCVIVRVRVVLKRTVVGDWQQQGRRGRQTRRIDTRGPGRRSCFVAHNLIIFLARELDGFPHAFSLCGVQLQGT